MSRIDEILAMPHAPDDFKVQEVPPSDDDSWLYGGEEELNSVLQERQREMELYEEQQKRKQKGKAKMIDDDSSNLGDIANSMKAFVQKVSSYQGAEVPENRSMPLSSSGSLCFSVIMISVLMFCSVLSAECF